MTGVYLHGEREREKIEVKRESFRYTVALLCKVF
jgi:hypothetical protein